MQQPEPSPQPVKVGAGALIVEGARDLFRPPFSLLLLLDLLILGASLSVSDQVDDVALFGTLLLAVVSGYVQIAMTMAAAGDSDDRSADEWIKLAFRRRVFLRFLLTGIATMAVILLGFLALIVGGLIAGAMLALAQPVSIQERAWPFEAMRRSLALSRGQRVPIGIVFALLYIVPTATFQVGVQLRWDRALGLGWPVLGLLATVASLIGVIALARAYVTLGGNAIGLDPEPAAPSVR